MIAVRRAMAVALMVVVVACGSTPAPTAIPTPIPTPTLEPSLSPSPSPSPTPSPSATPLPPPSPATGSIPAEGGTLAVPGGAALVVPAGALKASASATITGASTTVAPTDAWPADSVGLRWTVDLGGAKLAKPVTLTLPYDPATLPAGADPSELLLAYQDPASGKWVPVPATVDTAAHAITARVSHLSTWALFTINWDYWLGFIGKVASGNLTDLLGAVGTLTTKCDAKSGAFTVDNGATHGIIKGCVQKVANGTATIGVTNMRAIWFALASTSVPGTPVLEPGDTVTFRAGGTKLAQPLSAIAALSPTTFGYQLTDLVLRVLPGSEVFTKAGSYGKVLKAIVTAEDKAWGGSHLLAKLKANPPDVAGAAEEAFKLLTDASFLTVFAEAAIIAGQKYGVPVLTQLTPAILGKVLLAANLVVLIGTLLSWDVQYFLAAYGEVKVTWLVPPAAPTGTGVAYAGVVCPDGQTSCDSFVLTWREATGSVTGFRIYTSYSWGECLVPGCGPEPYPPCDLTSRRLVATVGPAVRRYATVIPMSVPYNCWFISAVNQAGASRIIYMGG